MGVENSILRKKFGRRPFLKGLGVALGVTALETGLTGFITRKSRELSEGNIEQNTKKEILPPGTYDTPAIIYVDGIDRVRPVYMRNPESGKINPELDRTLVAGIMQIEEFILNDGKGSQIKQSEVDVREMIIKSTGLHGNPEMEDIKPSEKLGRRERTYMVSGNRVVVYISDPLEHSNKNMDPNRIIASYYIHSDAMGNPIVQEEVAPMKAYASDSVRSNEVSISPVTGEVKMVYFHNNHIWASRLNRDTGAIEPATLGNSLISIPVVARIARAIDYMRKNGVDPVNIKALLDQSEADLPIAYGDTRAIENQDNMRYAKEVIQNTPLVAVEMQITTGREKGKEEFRLVLVKINPDGKKKILRTGRKISRDAAHGAWNEFGMTEDVRELYDADTQLGQGIIPDWQSVGAKIFEEASKYWRSGTVGSGKMINALPIDPEMRQKLAAFGFKVTKEDVDNNPQNEQLILNLGNGKIEKILNFGIFGAIAHKDISQAEKKAFDSGQRTMAIGGIVPEEFMKLFFETNLMGNWLSKYNTSEQVAGEKPIGSVMVPENTGSLWVEENLIKRDGPKLASFSLNPYDGYLNLSCTEDGRPIYEDDNGAYYPDEQGVLHPVGEMKRYTIPAVALTSEVQKVVGVKMRFTGYVTLLKPGVVLLTRREAENLVLTSQHPIE